MVRVDQPANHQAAARIKGRIRVFIGGGFTTHIDSLPALHTDVAVAVDAVLVVAGVDEVNIAGGDCGHDASRNSMAPADLASVGPGTGPWIACPPGGIENMDLMLNAAQENTLQLQDFVLV